MNVAIVELMPTGHVTLVESIARIYLTDAAHTLWIVGTPRVEAELRQILGGQVKVRYITRQAGESILAVLERLNECAPDHTYIVTSDAALAELSTHKWAGNLHWVIHNIDAWFKIGFWQNIYAFLLHVFNLRHTGIRSIGYWWKRHFIHPVYKRKILRFLHLGNHKFVVLNSVLKAEIQAYVPEKQIEIIPFSLYAGDVEDQSAGNTKLRLCIPGYVTQLRRDYTGLLKLLEQHINTYAATLELDCLGPLDFGDSRTTGIVARIEQLRANGLVVYTYEQVMPMYAFDERLARADVILGNLNIQLNKLSKYGKTKESGVPFTMIKAAKPGLLPAGYSTVPELASSTLFYRNYTELHQLLQQLITNKELLRDLKKKALHNAQVFTPANIYQHLSFD